MIKSQPASNVNLVSFKVEQLHNRIFSIFYEYSPGSDKKCLVTLDKTIVKVTHKRNLALRKFKKQVNSRGKVDKRAMIRVQ